MKDGQRIRSERPGMPTTKNSVKLSAIRRLTASGEESNCCQSMLSAPVKMLLAWNLLDVALVVW